MPSRSRFAARAPIAIGLVASTALVWTPHVGATVDTTPPVITTEVLYGTPGANGWFISEDTVLKWSVIDLESDVTSASGCEFIAGGGFETAGTDWTCTATSAGGTSTQTYTLKIDTTPPTVSVRDVPEEGKTYTPETVPPMSCEASDAISGPDFCASFVGTTPGEWIAQAIAGDVAGNLNNTVLASYYVVRITPAVEGEAGSNGWWKGFPAGLSWLVEDPSEKATSTAGCGTIEQLPDTAGTTYTCQVVTAGGTVEKSITIKQDTQPPSVAIGIGPGTYTPDQLPETMTCSATDTLSGLDAAGCVVTGYSKLPGTHTVSATATDLAGNTTARDYTYSVVPYTFRGFYQPVDLGGVLNTVKAGRTVPMKFEVFQGPTELTNPSLVRLSVSSISCPSAAPVDSVTVTTTSASGLRYDTTSGQFVLNWRTPSTPGQCLRVTTSGGNGSTFADFKLT